MRWGAAQRIIPAHDATRAGQAVVRRVAAHRIVPAHDATRAGEAVVRRVAGPKPAWARTRTSCDEVVVRESKRSPGCEREAEGQCANEGDDDDSDEDPRRPDRGSAQRRYP